jgi:hypothetical protein
MENHTAQGSQRKTSGYSGQRRQGSDPHRNARGLWRRKVGSAKTGTVPEITLRVVAAGEFGSKAYIIEGKEFAGFGGHAVAVGSVIWNRSQWQADAAVRHRDSSRLHPQAGQSPVRDATSARRHQVRRDPPDEGQCRGDGARDLTARVVVE